MQSYCAEHSDCAEWIFYLDCDRLWITSCAFDDKFNMSKQEQRDNILWLMNGMAYGEDFILEVEKKNEK